MWTIKKLLSSKHTCTTRPATLTVTGFQQSLFTNSKRTMSLKRDKNSPHSTTVTDSLKTLKVAFRTPITQLADTDRPMVQQVVDAAMLTIKHLKKENAAIECIDHKVLTKTTQKANLTQKTPKEFRIERLYAVRASDVFVEIVLNKSLSLSGAVERGYAKALRDLGKRLTPAEKALVNEKFPARVFQGFGRSIVVMHNGSPDFGGPLITTLYKQDPDTDYIYIKHDAEIFPENLTMDFPSIRIIRFTQEEMVRAFTDIFSELIKRKQSIINEKMGNYLGLAPEDESVYVNRPRH